jgi:hypothetical protein
MSDKKPASPYRAIIEYMIENDERCGSPSCPLTMMGHLITGLPPELMDMIKEVDPSQLTRGEMAHREFERGLILRTSTTVGPDTRLELQPKKAWNA